VVPPDGSRYRLCGAFTFQGLGNRYERRDCAYETVSSAWESLYEPRAICGIAESFPEAVNAGVEAVLEVNECVRGP
jgi:hypothetical protein